MSDNAHTDNNSIREYLLVMRCQTGDEPAFFELYNLYSEGTLRYLKSFLDHQTAQDAHQEVWLNVYQKISGLANLKRFRTWLYQITRNKAVDYLRKSKRHSEILDAAKKEIAGSSIYESDDEFPDTETRGLQKAMEQLSVVHRDVLVLKYWDKMSYEEISLIVGCSVGTVRSRIFNAKTKLKEKLEQATNDAPG